MTTDTTFRVMLKMHIKPGMAEEFEKTWVAVGDSVTSHPANLGQWLSRSTDEDGVYYIVSDWVDEARFREFETSDRHLEHRQKLHPYRSGGSMSTMEVVAFVAPSATVRTHAEWLAAA
ncbi:antibiotic biosynthesis monooxygenase family protein [Couchioplanes azureus]|uniref:antibiotic biosynthesis monooxygenase family protein n=1 Tax=Couchioplanes caeruleus TaxID=56438 RepID=UPI001670B0AA|nr:antibiotic biosynthesis monooxygenase family protein [Couchioplanes caeruleus]GGQ81015.1 antibiotic biosynthesis monooxygenase [Couchioplanes caeruleus subsp. azureus]